MDTLTYELQKKDKAYYILNWALTIFGAAMVIMLRMGVMPNFVMLSGIPFSTSDFFFIVVASLCGYKYGVSMFGIVFVSEIIARVSMRQMDFTMLYSLFIYLIIALISGYFSYHRWYSGLKRTFFAFLILVVILVNSWYISFIFLMSGFETMYTGLESGQFMLGSNPEVFLAVALVYIALTYLPDKLKLKLGMGQLYTKEYREYALNNKDTRKSTLSTKVTAMSLIEAVILSAFCVIFFDVQLTRPGGNNIIRNGSIERGMPLFVMNLQLILLTMSVALPLALLFNEIILRMVVRPVNKMAGMMDKFFSGEREELEKHLEMIDRLHIHSGDEMEKLYHNLQKMVKDMSEHIDALEKEKQLEADLRVAEAKSEAKSTFLSNMSHEIRTPINAVLGMDEMILRESKEENTLQYAENIRTAGNTLLGLVNDILDFSKIEAGKMDIIEVDYDFASTLNDLVNMIGPRAEAKGLMLNVNVNPDMPNLLHGDEIRIKQVVTNILTNAVKYTEKGSVTLNVDYDTCVINEVETGQDAESAGGNEASHKDNRAQIDLKISVKDTGIGIKEEDLSRLFSAFERIEEERNRTIEGTGLGMNITQSLLNMMGSRLNVESVYGEGSTFYFTVRQSVVKSDPIGNYEEALKRSLAERKKYHESFTAPEAKILVTDDTKMNLTVIENLLKKTLVKIDTALSGAECLEKTENEKYDLIFLDHRMPEKDGIETLAELKASAGNKNLETPVVCLTANAVSGARAEYIAAGFTDYLTKPINPTQLESIMIKLLPEDKVNIVSDEDMLKDADDDTGSALNEADALPKWLTDVSALDISMGISNCGDTASYLSVLTTYEEAALTNAEEIRRFYESGDIPNYTIKVHALKSSSRIIGAMELGDLSERMENAGNSNDTDVINENTEKLLSMLLDLEKQLKPLIAENENANDDEDKPLIDEGALNEAYDTLKELAGAFDYDSFNFVMDSLKEYRLPNDDKARYNALGKAISKPDWDKVNEILQEI